MKLTKKLEAELKQLYDDYMESMFTGNLRKYKSFLAEDFKQIGTTPEEIWFSKNEVLKYFKASLVPVAGHIEKRNGHIWMEAVNELVLVIEQADVYVNVDGVWTFYDKARISSLLQKKETDWKFIQQHISVPDSRTEEGQTIAIEKINAENIQLRDAVKRRTIELENKTRELEIEAALERVRARAMAMQKSAELSELVDTVFKELTKLDFALNWCMINIIDESTMSNTVWAANPDINEAPESYHMLFEDYPFHHAMMRGWKERRTKDVYVLEGREKKVYDKYLFNETEFRRVPAAAQAASRAMKKYVVSFTFSNFGGLQTVGEVPLSETNIDILSRFGKVFDLTYTRFNDLQKAEAQAREAQIEASMERVRSRTMGMQKSAELGEVAVLLYNELKSLGITQEFFETGYVEIDEVNKIQTGWTTTPSGDYLEPFNLPLAGEPVLDARYEAWKNRVPVFKQLVSGEDLQRTIDFTIPYMDNKEAEEIARNLVHDSIIFYCGNFSHGYLSINTETPLGAEAESLLARFTRVFEQTYKRFLDLKKAETQAREAQIEAALERIRSRSMAMHKSEELADLSLEVVKQVQILGVPTWFCAFNIYDDDPGGSLEWGSNGQGTFPKYRTPREGVFLRYYEAGQKGETLLINEIGKDECGAHYEYLCSLPGVGEQLLKMKDAGIPFPTYQIDHVAFFRYGYIIFITYEPVPETHEIFKRFAKVFEQSYTRFLDLQKAEAQAKEAQVEAALERVRSRTMSMQKSDELAETAAVMFRQLISLGIEPNRLYIIIIKEETGDMEAWVTDEDGSRVSTGFTGNFNNNQSLFKMYEGWKRQQKTLVIDMQGEELQSYFHYLHDVLKVPFKGGLEQKRRVQHVAYFSKGLIGIASPEPQPADTLQLMERFAAVFNLTFTRFNDLKIAEAHALQAEQDLIAIKDAKKKAEDALLELQATQKQLIQAEKMASLGELTAGIAHEIQNPLNFVNNFSEVNSEMIAEVREAISSGNLGDAEEIIDMLADNEQKILYHGKRADAIVKGMLQHSRSSSGEKEPTNINALADEYLRLSYHGLKAKDRSFNATIKTDFDQHIGNINIIPQDIGRVLLNLINNAFYAVDEKKKQIGEGYQPEVIITTQRVNASENSPIRQSANSIIISVRDNGNGIPENIRSKIFQPFFTTKPTGQGTGLGLSLSYDIIKAHDGTMNIRNAPGGGAEFIVTLPLISA